MITQADARRAVWVLLIILLVAQPLSMLAGTAYLERWGSAGNAYKQWAGYRSLSAPDVLVLGDSRVRLDIDVAALSRTLGVTVGAIGIDAAKPHLLEAVVARIADAASRPRSVVIALSEYQLNATWDANPESRGAETPYFWQMSGPLDARFLATALRLDPDRGRLLAGWGLPVLANYSVIVEGVRCDLAAFRGRSDCVDDYADRDRQMSDATLERWVPIIRESYLGGYAVSETQRSAVARSAALLRQRDIAVRFVTLPVYRVGGLAPDAYATFTAAASTTATEAGTKLIDLHALYDEHPELFFDPNHLTRTGAQIFAAQFGREISRTAAPSSP